MSTGDGFIEEKTGLHHREFIETRRFTFTKTITVKNNGSFHILNLVEGPEITIHSIDNSFNDFKLHYAEVMIIPATIDEYEIIPDDSFSGTTRVLKSSVRC